MMYGLKTLVMMCLLNVVYTAEGDKCSECKHKAYDRCSESVYPCADLVLEQKAAIKEWCGKDTKCVKLFHLLNWPIVSARPPCSRANFCVGMGPLAECQCCGDCPGSNILQLLLNRDNDNSDFYIDGLMHLHFNNISDVFDPKSCNECKRGMCFLKDMFNKMLENLPKAREILNKECDKCKFEAGKKTCKEVVKGMVDGLKSDLTAALDQLNKQTPEQICTTLKFCPS